MRAGSAAAVLLSVAAGLLACASPGVPLAELPEAPIAMLYWTQPEARRRAEVLAQAERPQPGRRGVARAEALADLLSGRSGRGDLAARLAQWPGHLSLLNPQTGVVTRLESAPPGSRPLAWSPDRRRLLFVSARPTGRPQLFEVDLESREVVPLTRGAEAHPRGDYGPGEALVYAGVRAASGGVVGSVYVRASSQAPGVVVVEGGVHDSPRFAPDGRSVLYVRPDLSAGLSGTPPPAPLLISRSLDPGAAERVLGRGRDPVYTPGGRWIVYAARSSRGWRLRRMRPDGSGKAPVGRGARDETAPAVGPAGRHVAYISEDRGIDRLFLRRLDGSGDRILLGDGAVAWPVW